MPAHVIDSIFFADLYGSAEMRAVFDDLTLLQKWLDFEAALARAEASVGLDPGRGGGGNHAAGTRRKHGHGGDQAGNRQDGSSAGFADLAAFRVVRRRRGALRPLGRDDARRDGYGDCPPVEGRLSPVRDDTRLAD